MTTGVGTGPVGLATPGGTLRMEVGLTGSECFYNVDGSGNIFAPRWAVPQLMSHGCTRLDLQTETIVVRDELAATTVIGDLFAYISSQAQSLSIIDPATSLPRDIAAVRTQALAVYDAAGPTSV